MTQMTMVCAHPNWYVYSNDSCTQVSGNMWKTENKDYKRRGTNISLLVLPSMTGKVHLLNLRMATGIRPEQLNTGETLQCRWCESHEFHPRIRTESNEQLLEELVFLRNELPFVIL